MSQDELHVTSEEVVFEAVVRWVKHEREVREVEMPRLLTCVRLPLVTPQFLSDKVATEELVRSSHKCRCVSFTTNSNSLSVSSSFRLFISDRKISHLE